MAKIVQLTPHLGTPEMHLFDSLQEMREATTPNGTNLVPEIFVAEAQEALVRGTHYVELDI